MSEIDEQGLYLEPKRHIRWRWWIVLGVAGILLLGAGSLAIALGARYVHREPPAETRPTMTLVPTYTPVPQATPVPPVVTLSVRPWTDDRAPVGMVEVTLSLPAAAQVRFQPPPGFRYWRGDLLQTRQELGWAGTGEVRWYLLREPGATSLATLEVTVNGQVLAITLQPAAPATISVPVE